MPDANPTKGTLLPADARMLYRIVRERIWMILAIVALCAGGGIVYLAKAPRIYEATTTIEVDSEQQKRIKPEGSRGEEKTSEELLKTIEQKLVSPALITALLGHPDLVNDAAFLSEVPRPASEEALRGALDKRISALLRSGTHLIDITVEDRTPAMAQKLARLAVDAFASVSTASTAQVSQSANEFLKGEAERLKAALAKSERALQDYREQHQAVSLEEKQNIIGERLKELNAKVTTAKAERLKLAADLAQVDQLSSEPPERLLALTSIAASGEVQELKKAISEKEAEMASLKERYKEEHPRYIQAASGIAEMKAALVKAIQKAAIQLRTANEAAAATEASLERALNGQEALALELSGIAIPYQELLREVESDRGLYDSVLARMKQTDVSQGVANYSVSIVAPASLPSFPVKPNKRAILLLSIAAGLAIGLTLALGLHLLDDTFKTVDQAETALGLRSLSAIPTRTKKPLEQVRRYLIEKPQSAITEAFRTLRTALLFTGSAGGYRSVLFTSAIPGEGKSFCASNYAVALALQGHSTLLIDADLRLPSIGTAFFGDELTPGLGDLLGGQADLASATHRTDIENLSVLPAGSRVSLPAELLGSANLPALIASALTRFERVVIDTAPVHAVSETLLITPHADAVCLVVHAAKTPAGAVKRALEKVRESGANVVGFILNALPANSGGYYYHYQSPGYGKDEVYGASGSRPRTRKRA